MNTIDWDKAPSWANVVIRGEHGQEFWSPAWGGNHKVESLISGHTQYADMHDPHGWTKVADRGNSEWTGEGLPPVGTVCEIHTLSDTWAKVVVVAITDYRIYCERVNQKEPGELCPVKKYARFRPIRTPEQIAAEQYERDAEELAKILAIHEPIEVLALAKLVLECGYRKQVTP